MASNTQPLTKRLKIDKDNTTILVVVAIAIFVTVFSLVSSKVLISQMAYQNRVTNAKRTAVNQLKSDINSISTLNNSYKAFVSTPQNVLGGNPSGSGQNDGDNAKIILDALPSQYDFPGLVSSLQSFLSNQGFSIVSIGGSDNQLSQSNPTNTNTSPQQMPFTLQLTGSYNSIKKAIGLLQASIRPISIQSIQYSGSDSNMTVTVNAFTYYQPATSFNITTKVIK